MLWDFFCINKKGSDKLYIVFSGARGPQTPYPLFRKHSWNHIFDGSVLYISDPLFSKYSQFNLGWYLGTNEIDLYPIMASIIKNLAVSLNISEIISYGSSGGGFASLKIAEFLPIKVIAILNFGLTIHGQNTYIRDSSNISSWYRRGVAKYLFRNPNRTETLTLEITNIAQAYQT